MYEVNHSFSKHCDINKFDNKILKDLESKYSFLANVFNELDKFSRLKSQIEKKKRKKQMCMIKLQSYIMTCQKHILMNNITYRMLKEVKWTKTMILLF